MAPVICAMAAHAQGSVLIAEGQPGTARAFLRDAWAGWTELGAPYEAARARALIATAQRASGNEQGAALELVAARSELRRLAPLSICRRSSTSPSAPRLVSTRD